jgi:hypothetical protein
MNQIERFTQELLDLVPIIKKKNESIIDALRGIKEAESAGYGGDPQLDVIREQAQRLYHEVLEHQARGITIALMVKLMANQR